MVAPSNPIPAVPSEKPVPIAQDLPPVPIAQDLSGEKPVPTAQKFTNTKSIPKKGFLANLNPVDKWKAIFTVSFVATILTIAELVVIYHIVFVDIQEQLEKALQSQVTQEQTTQNQVTSFVDSLFGTIYIRERDTIGSLNAFILSAAVMFVLLLILFTFYAAVKLASLSKGSLFNVYMNACLTSTLTLLLIGLFQGFPCIMNPDGLFCYSNSFMMFTRDWIFNENYLGIVWNTGLCADYDPYQGGEKTMGQLFFDAISPQVEEEIKNPVNVGTDI
jgi:uncharacterized membrane protein